MSEQQQPDFHVAPADWQRDADDLTAVREDVFIREQGVSREEEMDGLDELCAHVVARDQSGQAIGTARLDTEGHIGRVAVLKAWRGAGVGKQLMEAIMALAAEQGRGSVVLNSQVHASGFYQQLGFVPEGEEFEEAGIPHIKMVRMLA